MDSIDGEAFDRAVLSALQANIAVLDTAGVIVATNEAWDRFARDNGGYPENTGVGCSYLAACRPAASFGGSARKALTGIESLLGGGVADFTLEYPCHSPAEQRWFLMSATRMDAPRRGCVVSHVNITARKRAEIAQRAGEARWRALLEAATDGVLSIDPSGAIEFCNAALERMFAYRPGELSGRSVRVLFPEVAQRRLEVGLEALLRRPAEQRAASRMSLAGRRRTGEELPVEVSLGAFATDEGPRTVAFVRDVSERRRAEELLRSRNDEIQRLAGSLLTAREDEARRVARLLHDDFGQDVAALALRAAVLLRRPGAMSKEELDELVALKEIAGSLTHRMRDLSQQVHPAALEALGLAAALRARVGELSKSSGVTISLRVEDGFPNAKGPAPVQLYRIALEALGNALRHSGADRVEIELTHDKVSLTLAVSDRGRGFDPVQARREGRLGLVVMEERARLAGGSVTIESRPGDGARVTVRVPRERSAS